MNASAAKRKLTRPQRLRIAWVSFIIGTVVLLWLIWGPSYHAWTTTPTGTTVSRGYGLLRYLTVTRQMTGPIGGPAPQTVISTDWQWKPAPLLLNAIISGTLIALMGWSCRRSVRKDRLVGRCDHCGYDFTGLQSERCPECGAAVDDVEPPR